MQNETIKNLIKYYKWVVHISLLIIGVSISIISSRDKFEYSDKLVWGIVFLLLSIFLNWLLIKRLTTNLAINSEQTDTPLTRLFFKNQSLSSLYGLLQNWLFIIGFVLVVWSFISGNNIQLGFGF